jgi:hypothetical protein
VLFGLGQFVQYTDGRCPDPRAPLADREPPTPGGPDPRPGPGSANVSTLQAQATGLRYHDGRVTGVRYRSSEIDGTLPADLVVDAMGRASRLADWLSHDSYDIPRLQRLATTGSGTSPPASLITPGSGS